MASTLLERRQESAYEEIALANVPRIDSFERVSGRAKYVSDWRVPGMLYAKIITSSIPCGIVKAINIDKIRSIAGVKAVVTCLDDSTVWSAGERKHMRKLFEDHPRFMGDCIGAVAATTRDSAEFATDQVVVDYDELPAVLTLEDALKANAPKVWETDNPVTYEMGSAEEVEKAFKRADKIFEGDYKTQRTHPASIEAIASLAWWDGEVLTVIASTQRTHGVKEVLAKDLRIPPENVKVICKYKGGGFGNRTTAMNYDLIAAILSKKTGRPVMVEFSREQDFVGLHTRWSTSQHVRAAVSTTRGELLGFEITAYGDFGAYNRRPPFMGLFSIQGEEYVDAANLKELDVYTNTPTTGNVRATSDPHSNFATETLVDEIAYALKMNPLDLRLKNVLRNAERTKSHHTSFGLVDCFKVGTELFGWSERWSPPPSVEKLQRGRTPKWTGVGVAMGKRHARVGKGEAHVKARPDGKIEVHSGIIDIGQGAKSAMAIIASKSLGVPLSQIEIFWGDTETTPDSVGEAGSRTTTFVGTAVKEACLKLKEDILVVAAQQMGSQKDQLELVNGMVRSTKGSGKAIDVAAVLRTCAKELEENVVTDPKLPEGKERSVWAVHFAEVEVDVETGLVSVQRYAAIHDSGQIVNLLTAESQVRGGVVNGIGMALFEEMRMNLDYGSFQNTNFMNYKVPTHMTIPRIDVRFVRSNDSYGPKALGEMPIVPVSAAIGNAIFNATGIRLRETPFTPEKIVAAVIAMGGEN